MVNKPEQVVGANAGRARSHNRQVVLGRVRDAGQIGRAEIARASGLSTQAVSNIIADLLRDGMIREQGRRSGLRGLPAVQYALNPDGAFALGIEIRPDAILAALLDLEGDTVFSTRESLPSSDVDGTLTLLAALKTEALKKTGIDAGRLLGAGVVMPGPFGLSEHPESGSELAIWHDCDPRTALEAALDLPVAVENDANAAAMAEWLSGAASGLESFAFIYFGTGLGLGVMHEGRLLTGAHGNAGELGHVAVPTANGTVALETAVSRLSVQAYLAERGVKAQTMEDLAALYAATDSALFAWLDDASLPLSVAINVVENLFDPQTIVLGGAMPDDILDHLIRRITLGGRSVADRPARAHPRLQRGTSGRMSATLGAAALILNGAFTPRIAAAG